MYINGKRLSFVNLSNLYDEVILSDYTLHVTTEVTTGLLLAIGCSYIGAQHLQSHIRAYIDTVLNCDSKLARLLTKIRG